MIKVRGGVGTSIRDIEVPNDIMEMDDGRKAKATIEGWWRTQNFGGFWNDVLTREGKTVNGIFTCRVGGGELITLDLSSIGGPW